MSRTKLSNGSEALDGKGDLLPNMTAYIEDALSEIYLFLSGSVSDVVLPKALPESRGGIGNGTESSVAAAIRKYGLRSFMGIKPKHTPVALCTVGYGLAPRSTVFTELSGDLLFIRLGKGKYKVTVPSNVIKVDGDYVFIRPDNFGNQTHGAVVSYDGLSIIIDVHPLTWDAATGARSPNTAVFDDVPDNTYMSFMLSNTLLVGT